MSRAISACQLISADGQGIVWAGRLLSVPIPERVAGVDLFFRLIRWATDKGYRVYLLGGTESVLRETMQRLLVTHPTLHIAGFRNGYFSREEEDGIVRGIQAAKPDILFVGMSSPKKEQFLERYLKHLEVPFSMGVGGTFDIIAGKVKRAPRWMQRSGLEWFHRFLSEPGRMWRRYLWANVVFLGMVVKGLVFRKSHASSIR